MARCRFPVRNGDTDRCGNPTCGQRCWRHPVGMPYPEWFVRQLVEGDVRANEIARSLIDDVVGLEAQELGLADAARLAEGERHLLMRSVEHPCRFDQGAGRVEIAWSEGAASVAALPPRTDGDGRDPSAAELLGPTYATLWRDGVGCVGAEVILRSLEVEQDFAARAERRCRGVKDPGKRFVRALIAAEDALAASGQGSPAESSTPTLLIEVDVTDCSPVEFGPLSPDELEPLCPSLRSGRYLVVRWDDEEGITRLGIYLSRLTKE